VKEPSVLNSQWDELQSVFRDVFEGDELTIAPSTKADDVEGWDSLTHVTLIIKVEKRFGVKFSSTEVSGLKTVGDLARLLASKQARK
jgi:acyl carrier protein